MSGTSNKFIDLGDISFASAEYLHNTTGFTKRVNRSYDDRFAKTGAKIGNVTQARLPTASKFNTDTSSTNIELQALNDKGMPVQLNKNYQRSFAIDAVDLTLSVDDFMKRYLQPHLRSLAAQIDQDGMLTAQKYFQNAVGTPGTAPNSLPTMNALVGAARQKLVEQLAPQGDELFMATPPSLSALGYTYATNQFNPQAVISDIAKSGVISGLGGFSWFETTLAPAMAAPTYGGTPLVNGASQSGSSLITDGWTSGGTTLTAGTTFTVANVYEVNAETKASLGYLKQFSVVTTVSDTTGAITVSVSPEIVGPSDPRQNVSALPADNAAITVLGATGVGSNAGYAFHKDALIFATADVMPSGGGGVPGGKGGAEFFTASAPDLDLSVSIAYQYDIRSRQFLMRLDVLGGWAPLYPQLGAKVIYS
jgi:hypothetical protein